MTARLSARPVYELTHRLPADAGRFGDPRERIRGARPLELGDRGEQNPPVLLVRDACSDTRRGDVA